MSISFEGRLAQRGRELSLTVLQPKLARSLLILLGVLPAALLLADIHSFAVNVPFMDDWQFVPLLEKAKEGTLSFQDLWTPHDEHRLLLPRMMIIVSMFASGGDYRVQSFITFSVVAIISACLLWLMTRLNGSRNSALWAWVLVNIALFSPIQFHNWLWPMQFAYFLPYTFLTLCLCALYARIAALPKFALAALFALAGNYSFVQGNLIWPAVLPVIVFAPGIFAKEARKNFAIAWLLLGALAVTLYFRGLEHNSAAPDYAYGHEGVPPTMSTLHQLQEHPLETTFRMGRFVIAMFGNAIGRGFPVANNLVFSSLCGAIVLLFAVIGLVVAWKRDLFLHYALPWACLLLFTFLTAAFVCVGRVWRGDYQPLTPRYTTFGAFCIVALIPLLSAAFSGLKEEAVRSGRTRSGERILWTQGLLAGIYLTVQAVNWTYAQNLMQEWRLTRWHAQARLHFLGRIPVYAGPDLLGGKDELIARAAQILERLGMLKPPRATDLRISALGREVIPNGLKRGQMYGLVRLGPKGWHAEGFALASGGRSADIVLLGVQNKEGDWVAVAAASALSPPKYLRRSIGTDWEFLALSPPKQPGEWAIDLPADTFGNLQKGVLRAWAMDYGRHILYRLPGDQQFTLSYDNNAQEPAADETANIRL
jgi:hypothetical protein